MPTDEHQGPEGDDDRDPGDAFQPVAHEIRIGILRALWQAENHSLPFAELRRAVGVRDTGQFNYHLSKLEGRFVGHVDDRYELLYPGHRVVDAIQTGVFNRDVEGTEIPVDGSCPHCEGGLVFRYADFIARIACRDCEETVLGFPFDAGGFVGRDEGAAITRAFDRRTRRFWLLATDDVCPVCDGPTATRLVDEATTMQALDRYDDHYASDQPALIEADCQHCSYYSYVPAGVVVLDHPGIVGALFERGVDVRAERLWTMPFVVDHERVRRENGESDRLVVTVRADEDAIEATVDGAADVVAVTGID